MVQYALVPVAHCSNRPLGHFDWNAQYYSDLFSGNYTLEELSLLSEQDEENISKVPNQDKNKKEEKKFCSTISSGPDPSVKFTAIRGIKLQENPRQIIFPADFDGHIQIDVGLTSNFNFTLFCHHSPASLLHQQGGSEYLLSLNSLYALVLYL